MKKISLNKIEESLEIIIFIAIVVCQLLSSFVPIIDEYLSDDVSSILISVLLIAIYIRVMNISKIDKIKSFSFHDAIDALFTKKQKYKTVKVFAYSAKNYIDGIHRNRVKIDNLYLLLKQSSDEQAWFSKDPKKVKKYKAELSEAIDSARLLQDEGLVKNLVIRFYDFESYSHFGVFDGYAISGLLIPQTIETETVRISDVQLLGSGVDFGSADAIIDTNITFFDTIFDNASEISGLDD